MLEFGKNIKPLLQIHIEDITRIQLEANLTLNLTLTSDEHVVLRCHGDGILEWYKKLMVVNK